MWRKFKLHFRENVRRTAWPTAIGITAFLLFTVAGATQLLRANEGPPIDAQGSVYQSGKSVGWAMGVTFSRKDPAALEFEQIANATKLAPGAEFQYAGYVLKISQIRQVEYVSAGTRLETKLHKVLAKIQ